jgi:hypothetical protein
MNISYRHLAMEAARSELDVVKSGGIDVLAALERDDFHLRPFTDSGISSERLLEARIAFMKELGAESGNIQDIKVSEGEFDKIFARIAQEIFHDMSPIDGFNRDVWSYITMRVLPDLALWRWKKNKTDERFIGGSERSCFQRLWLRSYVLGRNLASQLQEDEAVNIFERPEALGGNKRLSLAIVNFIVDNRGIIDSNSGEKIISTEIVGQTAKRLRRAMSVQVVQTMVDSELEKHVAHTFGETLKNRLDKKRKG